MAYSIKKLAGQNVSIRKNDQGLLVLRTKHAHAETSDGFFIKTRSKRKRIFMALIAGGFAFALLTVLGLVMLDQALAVKGAAPAPGANAAAMGSLASINIDTTSDLLFLLGLPVFAIMAGAQVFLLIQIREKLKS